MCKISLKIYLNFIRNEKTNQYLKAKKRSELLYAYEYENSKLKTSESQSKNGFY